MVVDGWAGKYPLDSSRLLSFYDQFAFRPQPVHTVIRHRHLLTARRMEELRNCIGCSGREKVSQRERHVTNNNDAVLIRHNDVWVKC